EEPAVEEPASEEPAVEEPAVEEPASEEPAVEEPAVEEPTIEEPIVVEGHIVEEPAVEEPASEELEASPQDTAEVATEEVPVELLSSDIVTEQPAPDIIPETEARGPTSEEPTAESSLDEKSDVTDMAIEKEASEDPAVAEALSAAPTTEESLTKEAIPDSVPATDPIPESISESPVLDEAALAETATPEEAIPTEDTAATTISDVPAEDAACQEPTTEGDVTETAPTEPTEPAATELEAEATEQTEEALDTAPEPVSEEVAPEENTPENVTSEDSATVDVAVEEQTSQAAATDETVMAEPTLADPVPESSTDNGSPEAASEEPPLPQPTKIEEATEEPSTAPEGEGATPQELPPTSEEIALPAENEDTHRSDDLITGAVIAAGLGAAGCLAAANIKKDLGDDSTAREILGSNTADAISRRSSSDKLTQTLANPQPLRQISMADQKDVDVDANFNIVQREGFSDSGTQTDTSVLSGRPSTPAVVLPELPMSPAAKERALRRQRKVSVKKAEELVAAAVVIYATAEALRSPMRPSSRSTQITKATTSWESQIKIKPKRAFLSRKRRRQRLVKDTGDAATLLLTTYHPTLATVEAKKKAEKTAGATHITRITHITHITPADDTAQTANGLSDLATLSLALRQHLQRDRTAVSQKAHRPSLSEDTGANVANAASVAGGRREASAAVALNERLRNKLLTIAARKNVDLRARRRKSVNAKLLSENVNATDAARENANVSANEPEVIAKPEEMAERSHRRSRRHSTAEHHRPERTLSKRNPRDSSPGNTKNFFSINAEGAIESKPPPQDPPPPTTKGDMPTGDNAGQGEATGSRGIPKRANTTRERHSHSHSHTRRSEDIGRPSKLQKAREQVAEEASRKATDKPRSHHSDDSRRRAREEERRRTRDSEKERERGREKEKEKPSGIKGMFKRLFN
ncbi:hypothetical protein LZ32DRAFT_662441, partial [Colletotrichum eremochloae]